jgi:hypothetical protein
MLKQVSAVAAELSKLCDHHDLTLEQIVQMFTAVTVVDHIVFVRYDMPSENPIWGEFTRWARSPGVYAASETVVEIRYASHLLGNESWLRFVICKELCHSLDAPSGKHDVSERAVGDLVTKFSLLSSLKGVSYADRVFRLEILAELGAIELLCPLPLRREYVAENGVPNQEQCDSLAEKYCIPAMYMRDAFLVGNMDAIESIISAG